MDEKGKQKIDLEPKQGGGAEYYDELGKRDLSDFPVLMNKLPKNYDTHEDIQAIQSLIYDGNPLETATSFKENADESFKEKNYEQAIHWYGRAIAEKFDDDNFRSILHSNRAAANLRISNYGKTRDDCINSIALNPKNIKSHFRLARSYYGLRLYDLAISACEKGLEIEPASKDLQGLLVESKKKWNDQRASEISRISERNEREMSERALEDAMRKRGVTIGKDELGLGNFYVSETYLDKNESLIHWSIVFLYDVHNQSDFIRDCPENATFYDILISLFPEKGERLSWDKEGEYTLENLLIYYKTEKAKKRWRQAKLNSTIEGVLSRTDCSTCGKFPVFHIIPKSSNFDMEAI